MQKLHNSIEYFLLEKIGPDIMFCIAA